MFVYEEARDESRAKGEECVGLGPQLRKPLLHLGNFLRDVLRLFVEHDQLLQLSQALLQHLAQILQAAAAQRCCRSELRHMLDQCYRSPIMRNRRWSLGG